jgi:hypothetical protein
VVTLATRKSVHGGEIARISTPIVLAPKGKIEEKKKTKLTKLGTYDI